jgi:hypothetical protein
MHQKPLLPAVLQPGFEQLICMPPLGVGLGHDFFQVFV